jgi:DNA polymerase I-like protein with 3'-5' exonuclease and polymerase domains
LSLRDDSYSGYCDEHFPNDEIIVEARDDIADQVQAIVKESMEEALERIIPEVPFIVEPQIADSWKS